jgi:hypothetical protein
MKYTEKELQQAKDCYPIVATILRGNYYVKDKHCFEEHNEQILKMGNSSEAMYCYCKNGKFAGGIDDLKHFFQYDCVSDDEHSGVLFSKKENGYIGFSHRAAQLFKIGYSLFDETWRPNKEDITQEMIDSFEKTNEGLNTSNYTLEDKAVESISFKKRGFKQIKTLEEARQAAINFANYIS